MIRTVSPVDGSTVVERKTHTKEEITSILATAKRAFHAQKNTPLSTRIAITQKFLDLLEQNKQILATH